MTGIWRVRAAILTLIGALGVHQARFLLAPPEHEHELAGVHHYLTWLLRLTQAEKDIGPIKLRIPRKGFAHYERLGPPLGVPGQWEAPRCRSGFRGSTSSRLRPISRFADRQLCAGFTRPASSNPERPGIGRELSLQISS